MRRPPELGEASNLTAAPKFEASPNWPPESDCCDSCPFNPTCEEERQFLADIGLYPAWGEEDDDVEPG
jgi:hypothetical protein